MDRVNFPRRCAPKRHPRCESCFSTLEISKCSICDTIECEACKKECEKFRGKCPNCKKKSEEGNEYECYLCGEYVCYDCKKNCECYDPSNICSDHWKTHRCSICKDNVFCGYCGKICCVCQEEVCEDCRVWCNVCDEIHCDDCGTECDNCGEHKNYIMDPCAICKNTDYCEQCGATCDICQKDHCSEHLKKCQRCEDVVTFKDNKISCISCTMKQITCIDCRKSDKKMYSSIMRKNLSSVLQKIVSISNG